MQKTWEVCRDVIRKYGAERLAFDLKSKFDIEISPSQVYRYAEDPYTEKYNKYTGEKQKPTGTEMPGTLYIPVTVITKDTSILQYIAEACNCIVIPLPGTTRSPIKTLIKEMMKTTKEFSELMRESSKDLSDNKLTSEEKQRIVKEANELIEQTIRYKEAIKNG